MQVKVLGELVNYPRGKSAMVWYGVVRCCTSSAMSGVLDEVATQFPNRELVWRHLVVAEAEARHDELVARFRARFGAPPGARS